MLGGIRETKKELIFVMMILGLMRVGGAGQGGGVTDLRVKGGLLYELMI